MADMTRPDSKNPPRQAVPDGAYLVDPDRTGVRFRVKAFGLLRVGGSLPVSGGELRIEGGHLHGTGTLAADRIDTGLRAREDGLRIRAAGTLDRTPFAMLPPLAGVSRLVQVSVTLIARPFRPR